ncbi:MAG: hypothetical protein Q7S75_03360 [bacterium]|nr:hypothetical protein [bacterium]
MRRHFEKRPKAHRKEIPEPKPQFYAGKMVSFWHLIPVCNKEGNTLGHTEECGWGKIVELDVVPVFNESLGLDFGDKKIEGYWKPKIIGFRYPRIRIKVSELIPSSFSSEGSRKPLLTYIQWFENIECTRGFPVSKPEERNREEREVMVAGEPLYFRLPKASVLLGRLDTSVMSSDQEILLESLRGWREETKSEMFVEVSGENVSDFCFEVSTASGEKISNFQAGSFSHLFHKGSAMGCQNFLTEKGKALVDSWTDVHGVKFRARIARLADEGLMRTKVGLRHARETLLPEGVRRKRQRSKRNDHS